MDVFMNFLYNHSRFAIPVEFAMSFYLICQQADIHLAKPVRDRFSAYLLSARYELEFPNLNEVLANVFLSVFGDRHFSWKCFKRSAVFSTLSLLLLLIFTLLYNPMEAISAFRMNIRNSHAMAITCALFAVWIFWCIIPDYFSLAKSRILIKIISTKQISILYGVIIIIVDFIAGSILFVFLFSIVQSVAAFLYTWYSGNMPQLYKHTLSEIDSAAIAVSSLVLTITIVEAVAFLTYGNLYYVIPYADLFWASMWPSAWIWSYIALSILTRNAIKSFPVARWLVGFLDFESHAFRELGLVGAFLVVTVGYIILGVVVLKQML